MSKSKITQEELKTVEGVAGAKAGLTLAAKMEILKAKTFAIPMVLGSAAAMLLPGKETERKVKNAIKFVKESEMDKATYVFEKMGVSAAGVGAVALIAGSLAPKPRKTATSIATPAGKNIKMKKMINLPRKK